jgi:hypothetical protein
LPISYVGIGDPAAGVADTTKETVPKLAEEISAATVTTAE